MMHLNKTNAILPFSQRFHNAIDAVTGQAKNGIDSPIMKGFNQYIQYIDGGVDGG